ncbi:neuroligin-4, X-linked-like isoform X2 [Daphnia carinata]|uniref:neuroligin-4, X-linked-like isoform X2 n=1 Tax=Daphnia carinata TaxID=120202 RepID=UPI00258046AE|nr:neuroligin-4, X-linked-like isoform X2 [Daphnia carinata]
MFSSSLVYLYITHFNMLRPATTLLVIASVLAVIVCVAGQMRPSLNARIVRTKHGSVKGVLVIPSNRELPPVEAFLGLPYASPPVGPLRFMSPVSPLPWNGVRLMDKYPPACPQTLPDVSNEREALRFVTRGRLQYLRRLLPYLRNQSEDCLYLNIYAPVTGRPVGGKDVNIKFPVIVFIHGESYEWNSGNPYDGSILASYGDVVVVTINFRLGVLGFLRPDLRENRVANFGLLDQIAALQWIQDNIAQFGGDRDSVTLLGHGTGAACVNLLLISPVAQASSGLFHRAILMSGTALADWAVAENPLRYTLQAAQQVDCPLAERDDELAACLRFKRVTELMNVRLQAPLYASPLAPLVDGIVVPNEPRQSMKTYNELFGRYDVMYGVTQSESFHLLNAATLQFGLTETERNRIIRTYVRNSYASNIDQVTAAIRKEYTDWKNPVRDTEEYRDSILEILSDARVVAPVIQMADLHSAIRQRSYFYVFTHQTTNGDYPQDWGSIHGEELAYVFGMPLVGGTNHLSANYTRAEMLLSEIVITYWANFARTGNPNFPPRQKFLTTANSRDRFEPTYVQWPAYDRHSQKYLNIDLRPKVKDHYRADKMALWSKLIPELMSTGNGKVYPSSSGDEDEAEAAPGSSAAEPDSSSHSPSAVMGAQPEVDQQPSGGFQFFPSGPVKGDRGNSSRTEDGRDVATQTGGIALSIVIVIGICFLVLNVCACAGVFYQRDRVRFKEILLQRQYKLRSGNQGEDRPAPTSGAQAPAAARETLLALHRVEEDFTELDGSGNGMEIGFPHQASTSTMDPHTKVSQWMAQEVTIERCPTPPVNNRLTKPPQDKLGGSDRYDSRGCDSEDSASALFPLLTKSAKTSDIYGLLPVQEENTAGEKQRIKTGQSSDLVSQTHDNGSFLKFGDLGHVGESSPPFADSASSARTVSRSSMGRRKARSKSQLGSQRSITTKRDVAVGDDEDDGSYRVALDNEEDRRSSAVYGCGTMDTIRRLNLPKVLPDLPLQDVPAGATASSSVPFTMGKSNLSNIALPDRSPPYTIPHAGLQTSVDSVERSALLNKNQCQAGGPPSASAPPYSDVKKQSKSRRKQPDNVPSTMSSEAVCTLSSPTSTIVKTNLPQTVVVAPHPRATVAHSSTANRSVTPSSTQQPEPCLVVRPGPRQPTITMTRSHGGNNYESVANDTESPSATGDVVLRRPRQQEASTSSRPASRNSRSWYAQYSQSFISQSIDQESDKNDN